MLKNKVIKTIEETLLCEEIEEADTRIIYHKGNELYKALPCIHAITGYDD